VKVGLFGGSFDPIHSGHIAPVQEARRRLGLERVIYLPTAVPPHKPGGLLAPPLARYAMVELALLAEDGLFVSPHELTLGRPAYTVETLEHFRQTLPGAELHLLIGADSFLDLPRWRRWRDLTSLARLVVMARQGWDPAAPAATQAEDRPEAGQGASPAGGAGTDADADRAALLEVLRGGRVELLRQPTSAVSSTRLRELLARGELPPAGWVPELVVEFIGKYRLYR
jgi:nicotinate-nucleotide adenylyltransferase